MRGRAPKVKDCLITADGGLFVTFNEAIAKKKSRGYITPEALHAIFLEYGEIPETGFNDFPGCPVVTEEAVFAEPAAEGDADEDGEDDEEEDKAGDTGGD